MPNPTFRVHMIGRGGRQSAVGMAAYGAGKTLRVSSALAAAAYRAGTTLRDERQQQTYDYSDRDDVRYETILAPDHAPAWAVDREALWNAVEMREPRKDSQLARSIIIALPRELSLEQNTQLLRDYVSDQFVSQGMVADIAIHSKLASDLGEQPHSHVLLTLREFDENGEWAKTKNRDWNDQHLVEAWRTAWETAQNDALEAAGSDERISMRSYAEQGINLTPQLHMGYRAGVLEQSGVETTLGEYNRDIGQENVVRSMMDIMLPDPSQAAFAMSADPALLHPDDISRLEDYGLDNDLEAEQELERE